LDDIPIYHIVFRFCSKIEERTRHVLSGRDVNELYDVAPVDEAVAEGDDVERTSVVEL
jgi:hypothetical protein